MLFTPKAPRTWVIKTPENYQNPVDEQCHQQFHHCFLALLSRNLRKRILQKYGQKWIYPSKDSKGK